VLLNHRTGTEGDARGFGVSRCGWDTGRATLPLLSIGCSKRHDTSKNLSGVRGLECPESTNSA
jgi:hypothetical protein